MSVWRKLLNISSQRFENKSSRHEYSYNLLSMSPPCLGWSPLCPMLPIISIESELLNELLNRRHLFMTPSPLPDTCLSLWRSKICRTQHKVNPALCRNQVSWENRGRMVSPPKSRRWRKSVSVWSKANATPPMPRFRNEGAPKNCKFSTGALPIQSSLELEQML